MPCDKDYVCLSCSGSFNEAELYGCYECHSHICPDCGGEVIPLEEWIKAKGED